MATIGESSGELREDVPLHSGSKAGSLCSCTEDLVGGSRFINVAFAVLTTVITIALFIQIYYGDFQVVPHGSVASDRRECSEIGTSTLKQGGNAVDAAVAAAICVAVTNPHSSGLDSGGQMMMYDHRMRGDAEIMDFSRDVPMNGIPKLLLSLFYVHRTYGQLAWKEVVLPAANLAKKGFFVTKQLALLAQQEKMTVFGPLHPGQKINMSKLGETLETFAETSTRELSKYINDTNKPTKTAALKFTFNNYNIYVPNSPSIGVELSMNLKAIEERNFTSSDLGGADYVSKVVEATQTIYSNQNVTKRFRKGTSSNVAVIDRNDYYVSLIVGMHKPFGSHRMATDGYFLDVKDDSTLFTRIPFILIDARYICGKRMVLGANDLPTASQLITALAISSANASSIIENPRFNIVSNGSIGLEEDHQPVFDGSVLKIFERYVDLKEPYGSCNIVEKKFDDLNSHSDSRGGGIASRF